MLEEEGFSVTIQAWDFRPGKNFVLETQNAATVNADFSKAGFETIPAVFEANLRSVAQQEPRLEESFEPATAIDFRAELFLDGKSKSFCRIGEALLRLD